MTSPSQASSIIPVMFAILAVAGLIMAVVCWKARREVRNSGQAPTKGRKFLLWWGFYGGMASVNISIIFFAGGVAGIDPLSAALVMVVFASPFGALMMQLALKMWLGILKIFLPGLFRGRG